MNCKNCSKELNCTKENCKPVKWSETKNYGICTILEQETCDFEKRGCEGCYYIKR